MIHLKFHNESLPNYDDCSNLKLLRTLVNTFLQSENIIMYDLKESSQVNRDMVPINSIKVPDALYLGLYSSN